MALLSLPRRFCLSLLSALLASATGAAPMTERSQEASEMQRLRQLERQRIDIYEVRAADAALLRKAAISFHAQVLESQDDVLIMELTGPERLILRGHGLSLKPASKFIAKRNEILAQLDRRNALGLDASIQSIPSFACYETVEETETAMQAFVSAKPQLASIVITGPSWQKTQGTGGYDLKVLKLTNGATTGVGGAAKPKLFVNSAIHAREYATAPLNLAFARWLVDGYGVNADATWILDHHEVHLLLHTNPDGRKRAEGGLSWRKNTNNNYCANTNTRGADLNRNFSQSWNSTGGSGSSANVCNETYRGPSAGSEPETKAIESYIRSLWPDRRGPNRADGAPADTSGIHLDIHSYSRLVLWPWGDVNTPAPNGAALQTLGRKFAFFNGYTPQQSIGLYATDGTSDAPSYGELGVAAFTFELGTSFFESCTSFENTIKPGNLPALIYAAKVVRTPYITPAGPDITSLSLGQGASSGGVQPGVTVSLTANASDARFSTSNGTEATQAIAAAEAYIDTPPWVPGAVALPLSASDGSFNSSTEGLAGTLSTGTLSLGRHTVFVRARDASGAWGAVTAAFLNVTNAPALDANFTASCNGLTCSFNGSSSGGAPSSYGWSFGDGSSGTGVNATKTYAQAGSFNVTLTVGNGSSTNSETQTVVVSSPSQTVAEVEPNNSRTAPQVVTANPVTINGRLASTTDTDFFSVSLPAGATLRATLTPPAAADYDLQILNSSGTVLARSELGTGAVDTATSTNTGTSAVTRLVRVVYYGGGAGNYTLRLQR